MDNYIVNSSAHSSWLLMLKNLSQNGSLFKDHTGRFCYELLNLNLKLTSFEDIRVPIEKMLLLKSLIYPKAKEIKSIILEKDFSFDSVYPYSYVSRIFSFRGTNQIDSYVIPLLKSNSLSRQGIISIWDPVSDTKASLVPSLIYVSFIQRNDYLVISSTLRSCDMFIGFPANIYQLYVLGTYVAEKLHVTLKEINLNFLSAHIFEDNLSDINSIVK